MNLNESNQENLFTPKKNTTQKDIPINENLNGQNNMNNDSILIPFLPLENLKPSIEENISFSSHENGVFSNENSFQIKKAEIDLDEISFNGNGLKNEFSTEHPGISDQQHLIETLLGNVRNIEKMLLNRFVNEEKTDSQEFMDQLRSNNLHLSKLERKIEELQQEVLSKDQNSQPDELLAQVRTNNLYLSKLDRKVEILQHLQEDKGRLGNSDEELNNQIRTNNLYLSKLERKIDLIQHLSEDKSGDGMEELLNQIRTNNLYLSKLDRKIEQVSYIVENKEEASQDGELVSQLRANSLHLARLERKMNELSFQTATPQTNSSGDPTLLNELISKIEVMNQQRDVEMKLFEKIAAGFDSQKELIDTLEKNIQNQASKNEQSLLEEIETAFQKLGLTTHPSEVDFPEFEHGTLGNILSAILESNQQLNRIESKLSSVSPEEGNDMLLKNIKTNNLYLFSIGNKISELLTHLEKLNQTKDFGQSN